MFYRSEGNRPKKKFVQPQIIRKKPPGDSDIDRSRNNHPVTAHPVGSAADSAVTAAAAASAAVAAAQPFLKVWLILFIILLGMCAFFFLSSSSLFSSAFVESCFQGLQDVLDLLMIPMSYVLSAQDDFNVLCPPLCLLTPCLFIQKPCLP